MDFLDVKERPRWSAARNGRRKQSDCKTGGARESRLRFPCGSNLAAWLPDSGILEGENGAILREPWCPSDLRVGRNGTDFKLARISRQKIAFAIIQEDGYQLVPPCRYQNHVKSTIAIYVLREERQPSGRSRDADRLRPAL